MYMQVADRLAKEITSGAYAPGSLLPSETELIKRFGVSRPTVRAAIAELRSMGLVESHHGKGTMVRSTNTPTAALSRTVSKTGKRYSTPELIEREQPAVTRTHLTGTIAELLGQDSHDAADAFSADWSMADPNTGARFTHRVIIPMHIAAEVPPLADTPDAPVTELYAHLAAAGHELWWCEYVTARVPLPDERAALGLTDASPILVTYRITYNADDHPLICEELHTAASKTHLAFRITTEKASPKRPTRSRGGSV
ncbi:GntR family transcriptional regulator [Streptomyces sp. bgisy100]|uniref:GntR family transcriptional regulator n=1 Tax=Streptomyces sp. bgisy100 TaxID=3413783 RepID=UPI003D7441E9